MGSLVETFEASLTPLFSLEATGDELDQDTTESPFTDQEVEAIFDKTTDFTSSVLDTSIEGATTFATDPVGSTEDFLQEGSNLLVTLQEESSDGSIDTGDDRGLVGIVTGGTGGGFSTGEVAIVLAIVLAGLYYWRSS